MNRVMACLLLGMSLSSCSRPSEHTGPVVSADFILSRKVGGVDLSMGYRDLVTRLRELGYRIQTNPEHMDNDQNQSGLLIAKGVMRRGFPGEICATPGSFVQVVANIRSGRVIELLCTTDGEITAFKPSSVIVDTVNSFRNTKVSILATDMKLSSFRALNAANMCFTLRENEFTTADDVRFCKKFKPSGGPYIYSFTRRSNSKPFRKFTKIAIHKGFGK